MATPNFHTANCSRYFVIDTPKYITQEAIDANGWPQEWLGEYDEEQTNFDCMCAVDNIVYGLRQFGWDRSNGDEIAYKNEEVYYGGCQISLEITAEINSGYYEGACMDLGGKVTVYDRDGYQVNTYDMFGPYAPNECDIVDDNWTGRQGLSNIQAVNIIRHMSAIIDDMKNEAEKVFSEYAEHELFLDWIAGNGEAGYSEAPTRLCDEKATA